MNAATRLVIGDLIFVSATYETGAAVLRVQGNQLVELWSSDEVLSNHYATSVYYKGHLFGFQGRQEYNPSFRCRMSVALTKIVQFFHCQLDRIAASND